MLPQPDGNILKLRPASWKYLRLHLASGKYPKVAPARWKHPNVVPSQFEISKVSQVLGDKT